ncbi:hypothetical protein DB88DRAFT_509816 [Papiliotrema laurentii]|uniref:Uncharacterized protein n=1 Tax=Papiliotrema laurentii TaxID=5418 RepID=A0AAD9L6M7_PAPLA|nr:hypothetical protein DB88DRAFT_509816 [Papiliotrema laurentii]
MTGPANGHRSSRPLRRYGSRTLYGLSAAFVAIAMLALALCVSYFAPLSAFLPPWRIFDMLDQDKHYKYLVPLLIPTTTWFVIANWVGWEYFRFA